MAEEKIYDGVGCPADKKSEKTIFRPSQKGDIPVVGGEQRRVIPTHSTDHSQVESDGTPKKLKAGDTKCDQDGEFLGPIIHRDPPKDQVHPEKKESGKKELSGI